MRFSAILPLCCSIVAFVLCFLCFFAGDNTGFMQDTQLMTLNISRLGHGSLFKLNVVQGSSNDPLSNILNQLQGDINNLLDGVTTDIASLLDLPDFYDVHVLDYCQGHYFPNATAKNARKDTSECTKPKVGFYFQPTKVIEQGLIKGVTLSDIHWPEEIQNEEKQLKNASLAMTAFYIIGIIFSGLGMLTALICIFTQGRLSAFFNLLVDLLAFLTIGVASGLATAIMVIATNRVNQFTDEIGIAANRGPRFLALTWAATGVMLPALLVASAQCCVGRRGARRSVQKEGY